MADRFSQRPRARDGFTVDLEWKDGKLVKSTTTSQQGRALRLRYGSAERDPQIPTGGMHAFMP